VEETEKSDATEKADATEKVESGDKEKVEAQKPAATSEAEEPTLAPPANADEIPKTRLEGVRITSPSDLNAAAPAVAPSAAPASETAAPAAATTPAAETAVPAAESKATEPSAPASPAAPSTPSAATPELPKPIPAPADDDELKPPVLKK
jgi:hypothetical protein